MSIPSYGKIWNLGHKQLTGLWDDPVVIQEKIDGSYIAFSIQAGQLRIRSKGQSLDLDNPAKLFTKAVESIKSIEHLLTPGYVYCGEYLSRKNHNTLAYDRVPENHIVLFDVELESGTEKWMDWRDVHTEAVRLRLEPCPVFEGFTPETLDKAFEHKSCLGGAIEGVVIKNYWRFGIDGKLLRGKYVSQAFREVHGVEWKKKHPTQSDIKLRLIEEYATEARWNKAVQHLREAGVLVDAPNDIGPLLKEINRDVLEECKEEIKEKLFKWAWGDISRGLTRGAPEWYRKKIGQ